MKKTISIILLSLIFLGCGGENGSITHKTIDKPKEDIENKIIKNDDQNIQSGESVTLNANDIVDKKGFKKFTWSENGTVLGTDQKIKIDGLKTGEHKITLKAEDENGKTYTKTIKITVKEPDQTNSKPKAEDITLTLKEDSTITTSLKGSDIDGDKLSYLLVSYPSHGKLSGSFARLSYTPETNYYGKDSFTFKTNDGKIDSNLATVSIDIQPVNDAPTADAKNITVDEDNQVDINLSGEDTEGANLTFKIIDQPKKGTITNNIYTPNKGKTGKDSFTFIANDGELDSQPAVVSITIKPISHTPVNHAPRFINKKIKIDTDEDNRSLISGQFIVEDLDGDDGLKFSTTELEGFTLHENGTYDLNLSSNFYQKLNDGEIFNVTLPITVTDSKGAKDEQNLSITIRGKNDTPIAKDDINITDEDTSITFNLLANDTDLDQSHILKLVKVNVTKGSVTFKDNGDLTFSPVGNFDKLAQDEEQNITLTYKIQDEHNATSTANVILTIKGVNDAPTTKIVSNTNDPIVAGQNITFNFSSSDIDGKIVGYLWYVDNKKVSNTSKLIYAFTQGDHDIRLEVVDDKGAKSSSNIINISVKPKPVSFSKTTIDTKTGGIISWLELADLDDDGDKDILVNVVDKGKILWYENKGNTNYTKHNVTSGVASQLAKAADIDGDGYLDIVFGSNYTDICYNNKDKTFDCTVPLTNGKFLLTKSSSGSSFTTENNILYSGAMATDDITSISINDIDKNGTTDILVTSWKGKTLELYTQDNNGNFLTEPQIIDNNIKNPIFVDSYDYDNDGDIDILTSSANGIKFYKNRGQGSFDPPVTIPNFNNPNSAVFADVNSIGNLDILSTHPNSIRWTTVENGLSGYVDSNITNPPFALSIDMNEDSDMDVVSNSNEKGGKILWYETNGGPTPIFTKHIISSNENNITITQAADMDDDGDIDVVSADAFGKIYIFTNNLK